MITHKEINYIKDRNIDLVDSFLKNLEIQKTAPLRILDVGGGGLGSWLKKHVTHVVDLFNTEEYEDSTKLFVFDMEEDHAWDVIFKDVKENGPFDFITCTHTLEDLHNPTFTCKTINEIGKAGFVSVPSKFTEFCPSIDFFSEAKGFKGHHHHRWVYGIKDNCFIGFPKISPLERIQLNEIKDKEGNLINPLRDEVFALEISFMWEDTFDFEILRGHDLLDNIDPPHRGANNQLRHLTNADDITWAQFLSRYEGHIDRSRYK